MVRDPADIEEQRRVEDSISAAAVAVEVSTLAVICRRLGRLSPETKAGSVYASMPQDLADIREIVNSGIKNIQALTSKAMRDMAEGNDEWARVFYEAAGKKQVSALDHKAMRKVLQEQAGTALENTAAQCRSAVVAIRGKGLVPVEEAYKATVEEAATSMMSGAKSGEEAIGQAVKSLSDSGLKVVYESGVTRSLYTAVSTNVMDAYRTAMGLMREIQGLEFGADGVEVSAHAESAPDHLPYQGRQYSYSAFKRIQDTDLSARPLETGANCVIEGTKVDASGATVMFRRHYEGEIVRIRTRFGNDLSVTPNHPILTDRGWVAAKDIQKGHNVVSGGIFDGGRNSVRPYDEHCIAAVEDCFGSASHKSEVFSFASSSTDFHGDGIVDQKVDVVFVDSELRNNVKPSVSEHVMHSLFHDASRLSDFRLGCSPLAERFVGLMASPDRIMGSGGDCASLFAGEPRHGVNGGVSPGCGDRMTVFGKNPSYDEFVDSKRFSNASFGHSALVERYDSGDVVFENRLGSADSSLLEARDNDFQGNSDLSGNSRAGSSFFSSLDEVIDVYLDSWAGHVYNLSTDCGYYLANGIITHNCGHIASPILMGVSSPKHTESELLDLAHRSSKKVSVTGLSGKKLSMSRYDATQYQRRVETEIRNIRERAYLAKEAGLDAASLESAAKELVARYKTISAEAGLSTRMERTRLYALG